jgi:hypothetical protein
LLTVLIGEMGTATETVSSSVGDAEQSTSADRVVDAFTPLLDEVDSEEIAIITDTNIDRYLAR